jgi:signal transduction histidine kinase
LQIYNIFAAIAKHLIMNKTLLRISLISAIILVSNLMLFCQINNQTIDSLLTLSKSKIDSIKLNALTRLTWEYRFLDPLKGFEYGFEGLSLAENLKKGKEMAVLHNYIGVLAIKIKSFDKAKVQIKWAYRIADSLNIPTEKAYALNNLGEIYNQTGKIDSAIICQTQSVDIFKSIDNLKGLAYSYNQLGLTMLSLKNFDEAIKFHKLSLESREKLKDSAFIAKALQNLGIDFLEKGSYAEARNYFKKMDPEQLKIQSRYSNSYRLILIGKTFDGENNTYEAINYYKQGFQLAYYFNLYDEMGMATKLLSQICSKMKDYKTALVYFTIYKTAEDSLNSINLVEEFKQLEMKVVFDQKYKYLEYKMQQDIDNQELKLRWNRILIFIFLAFLILLIVFIVILKRNFNTIARKNKLLLLQKQDIENQNEAIIKQRDELAIVNATKDKFFSIIAHDLRGPIGNFLNFTNMIIDYYREEINEKLMKFLLVVNASAQQTSALLENLLTWAQSQQGSVVFNPNTFNLYKIVENNISLLLVRADDKNISIRNSLPNELICEIDYYMIDTVVRNLLSNAIKFTSQNGYIEFSGILSAGSITIKISDSGIGLNQTEIDQLFRIDIKHKSKDGTNGEKGTGLGLILCKEFIEKHGGKIWAESELGKGSQFIFTIPLNPKVYL